MIFFKGQKAVLWTRANRDVANQDFSDHGSASYFHRVTSSKQKEAPQARGLLATLGSSSKEEQWWYNLKLAFTTSIAAALLLQIPTYKE